MTKAYALRSGAIAVLNALLLSFFFLLPVSSFAQTVVTEDFDSGIPATWSNESTNSFNWQIRSGTTPYPNTGPSDDAFRSGGSYLYINRFLAGSVGGVRGDIASFISAPILLTGVDEMQFYYHMWGANIGALDVEVESPANSGTWNLVWSIRGDQGNAWHRAEVDLSVYTGTNVRLRFIAELDESNNSAVSLAEGDVAIDLIQLGTNVCQPPLLPSVVQEDFSAATVAFNTNDQTSFILEYGPPGFTTPTGTVYPTTSPYTITGLSSGTTYEFTVASNCASETSLVTAPVSFTTTDCDIPTNVSLSNVTSNSIDVSWSTAIAADFNIVYGNTGFDPNTAGTTINTNGSTTGTISGLTPGTYDVYVAGNCSGIGGGVSAYAGPYSFTIIPPITCLSPAITSYPQSYNIDSEAQGSTSCTGSQTLTTSIWSNLTSDDADWTANGSGTGSSGTGPSDDITGGGKYLYLEASSPCFNSGGYVAILESECLDLSSLSIPSLSFYYHMYGSTMGTLDVQVRSNTVDWTSVWSKSGNQGDQWYQEFIDLSAYSGEVIKIRFRGQVGTNYYSDMALDNIAIDEFPTCFDFQNVSFDGVVSNDLQFTVIPGLYAPLSYEYVYVNPGDLPSTGTINTSTSGVLSVSNAPSATTLDFYFRGNCGGGDYTSWFGPIQILTPCNAPPCDVQIGSGSGTSSYFPIEAYYGYNYTQQIYYASEVNVAGAIDKIRFFLNSGSSASSWNDWVIYLGHTSKTSFNSTSDWVPLSGLNQVFSGQINNITTGTWIEINLDVPFIYNGTDNLVVAVDENTTGYAFPSPTWASFNTGVNRSIGYSSDYTNPNPATPPSATFTMYSSTDIAQVQLSIVPPPSCFAPIGLAADTVAHDYVGLSWTPNGSGTVFEVAINDFSSTQIVNGNTAFFDTLSPLTTYNFYVREICAPGDTSAWGPSLTITTSCLPAVAPFLESFDNTSLPSCWSQSQISGDGWRFTGSPAFTAGVSDHTGNGGSFSWIDFSSPADLGVVLELPLIDVTALNFPVLQFYFYSGYTGSMANYNTLFVDALIAGNWVSLASYEENNGGWVEKIVFLNTAVQNGYVKLRFRGEETASTGFYNDLSIDDVSVIEGPTCPVPTDFILDSLSSDFASLTWIGDASSLGYIVEYGTPADFSASTTTQVFVSAATIALNGLNSATDYDVILREVCSATDTSNAISLSFKTPFPAAGQLDCQGGFTQVVFTEEFNNNIAGWTGNLGSSGGNWEIPGNATSPNTGPSSGYSGGSTSYANFEASGANGAVGSLVSPPIDLSAGQVGAELSFWMHAFGGDMGTLSVGVGNSATGPFNQIFTWSGQYQTSSSDPWVNIGVDLSSYIGQVVYVQFQQSHFTSGWTGDMSIDLFEVSTCVSCPSPTDITLGGITNNTIDISWTAGPLGQNWLVQAVPAGSSPDPTSASMISGTTHTFTGLTGNTDYDVYVWEICPSDTSGSLSILNLTTLCDPYVAPFTETFDATTIPTCWSQSQISGDGWRFNFPTIFYGGNPTDHTNVSGSVAWIDFNFPVDINVILELPLIDVSLLAFPALEFYFFSRYSGSLSSYNTLFVEALVNGNWITLDSYQENNTGWVKKIVDISAGVVNGMVQLRFRGEETASTGSYNDLAIDDISIDEIGCITPTALTVDEVYMDEAYLSWNAGGLETAWQVYYGETGVVSAPGQNTVPTTTVSQTEINITGLTALTGYSVWVRSDCGGEQSLWTAAANFTTTTCPKVVIDTYPYTEGFDTTTVTQVPCGWAFDDGNSDNIQWGVQNRASIAQSNPSMARIEWNTTQDMDDHIMSPRIDLDAYEQVDITFSYRTRSDAFVERMSMAFAQDQNPTQMAAPFWNETNLTNTDYITETVTHRPTAAGEYAVAWHGFSTADQFAIYIDDVEIDRTECQSPYLITLDNSDFYSVDISWSGEGSNYTVEYGPAGFTPGSGTTVSVAGLATTLSGLSIGTNYEVYVTTDCGASGTSIPEGPFAFSTDCPTLNVVYADLCLDNGLFQLTGGLPLGGTYSGTGVDANGNFDPVVAGVGTHTITYSFPNMNACPVDVTAPIKVNALPVVNVAPFGSVCIGVAPFELTNGTPAGGVYSMVSGGNANAITNGNMFNPAAAGLGLHQIEYTYVDGNGCVNSQIANINITPLPTVTLAAQPSFCGTGDNPAALAGGSPAGGTYSGPGVVNGVFYPDLAGLGSHTITYTYFSGPGCSNTATRTIVVNDVAAVDAGADIEIQYGTNDQIMTSVVGGTPPFTYSWQPADSLVNPTNANPTTKNLAVNNTFIVYVTDAQGCVSTDTVEVTVKGGPLNLGTSGDVTICQGESATLVALPQGGSEVYSYYWTPATGLSAPNDSITVASPNQTRTYTLTLSDGFNVRSSTITVTVLPAPQVGMGQLGSVCVNAGSVMLDQGYPAGGVYMGTGVSGGQFDPAVAGVGNHTISYEYTDANGCSAMTTGTITVHAEPSVSFASLADVCLDAGDVILAGGAPLGGSYSGPGVAGGVFTPTNAGIGVHTIDYTYADINGCAVTVSQSIEVFALPSVGIASQGTVCIDGGAVTLTGGFPAGGTYSGTGVTSGSFDPAAAGLGAHAITYTYSDANGCDLSVQANIVVTDLPAVDHTNIAPVCVSDAAFMLSGGNPAGGSYSGTGVSGGMFNPAVAGVGSHVVVYSYTDGYGCTNSISKVVTVNDLPAVTLAPVADRCVNSAAVALTGGFPLGGSYSGAGVMNGMFNPAVAGVGAHTITYSYTNASGCQASAQYTVNVSAQPVVSFNVPAAVCTNNGAVTLTGGSPAGGSYSGAGVSNGMFYPSAVGAGSHTITYSYTDGNGCTSSTTATMIVYALPQVSAAPLGSVCINGGNVSLTGASPAGGTFSGPGVSGTSFDPVAAGTGTHVLTYSYTNANGCTNATNFSVTVNPQPIASFGAVGPVCVNAAPFTLLAGQPGGGNYSGTGVSNNTFNPAVAGVGSHVITYTYTNALGCTDVVTQTVDVIAEPTVTLAALSDVCKGDGSVTLSGGSPAGGTYSGPGVSAGAFNPVLVAAGTYTITYTYTAANGCASSDQSTITVLPAPVQPYITQSGNTLNAITTLTNVSYQWLDGQGNAIPGATNNTLDVQVNGFFYVQITDANGCTSISDVFVVDFTSINDPMAALQFELFPNPNAGRFQMNWTSLSDQDFQVAVTDARGKVIYTESVNARAGQMSELSVDLSDMAKGVYFVQLKGEEGVINRQVVIQ